MIYSATQTIQFIQILATKKMLFTFDRDKLIFTLVFTSFIIFSL